MVNSTLLKIFLDYYESGVSIYLQDKTHSSTLHFSAYAYGLENGDFHILDWKDKFVISGIDKQWKVHEYNTYIKIYNKKTVIHITENSFDPKEVFSL